MYVDVVSSYPIKSEYARGTRQSYAIKPAIELAIGTSRMQPVC